MTGDLEKSFVLVGRRAPSVVFSLFGGGHNMEVFQGDRMAMALHNRAAVWLLHALG